MADQFDNLHPAERELLKLAEAELALPSGARFWPKHVVALLTEVSRLRGALAPLEDVVGEGSDDFPDDTSVTVKFGRSTVYGLKLRHFRQAAAALSPNPADKEQG